MPSFGRVPVPPFFLFYVPFLSSPSTGFGWQRLYSSGIRNFVVLNVGPVGCVPLVRAVAFWSVRSCYEDGNIVAQHHNQLLDEALPVLQGSLPGATIAVLDVYTGLYKVGDVHGAFV